MERVKEEDAEAALARIAASALASARATGGATGTSSRRRASAYGASAAAGSSAYDDDDDDAAAAEGGGGGAASGGAASSAGGVNGGDTTHAPPPPLLSPQEREYLSAYSQLRMAHLRNTVFSAMPPVAGEAPEEDAARFAASLAPSLVSHVFVRVRQTLEGVTAGAGVEDDEPIDLEAERSAIVQYRFVKEAVAEGKAVL